MHIVVEPEHRVKGMEGRNYLNWLARQCSCSGDLLCCCVSLLMMKDGRGLLRVI